MDKKNNLKNNPKQNKLQIKQPNKLAKPQPNIQKKIFIQPKNSIINKNIKAPQPIPLTQEQIKTEKQKKQALQRLSRLHQVSQETVHKKSTLLLSQVTKNIEKDIIKSLVQIPEQPQEITRYLSKKKQKQKQSNPAQQQQKLQKQYENLSSRKQKMHQQLQQLQNQQLQLKKSMLNSKLFSSPNHKHNQMPELTEDVKRHWVKIKQIVKQQQQESRKHRQQNQRKLKEERQTQIQLIQKRNRQKSQQKRKVLQKKIQEIQKKHQQRTIHIKQEQAIIERLKNKKKLFQRMQQNWQNRQKQHQLQYQALMLQKYLKNRQVNMRQLRQYQKQHDQKYLLSQQNRKRRMSQSKISSSISNFRKSRIVDVLQEDKKNKAIEQQKINQIKQLIDKRKQYGSIVKQKFLPTTSRYQKNNQKPLEEAKTIKEARSLSAFDIKSKGNEYMRKINSSLANLKLKGIQNKNQQKGQFHQTVKQYKNYLKQLRMNRTANNPSETSNKEMDLINSIMKKPNASTEQKFFQAQMVTSKMESGGTSKHLLKSINAKMQILKKLSYNN